MITEALPKYSVSELNAAIGKLLERGFAPRFILEASVVKPQLKKGHLWLSLNDDNASINAVIWSSRLQKIKYKPAEGDGVIVVGKLNFWETRSTLSIQILDIRPSLSTVLRKFEVVSEILRREGLIDENRKRSLPQYPNSIAVLTSVPSSALADILRTAKESWPLTTLFVVPIPVQGSVANQIKESLHLLASKCLQIRLDAVLIARGGGSREDLMVFDDEELCRAIAACLSLIHI